MKYSLFNSFNQKNKITFRISLLFSISLLMTVLVVGFIGYKNVSDSYLENTMQRSHDRINQLSAELKGYLKPSVSDIKFLSDFYALKRFVDWSEIGEDTKKNLWRDVTVEAFSSFLDSKKRYSQIRYLDSQGREKIRLNYNIKTNQVINIPVHELQNKGHREYFKKSFALVPGTTFVSVFNLNREHGKIVFPYEPTIRFSIPIIDTHGNRKGIVIVNMIGDNILDILRKYDQKLDASKAEDFYMLNKEGYFLFHNDIEKCFGFDLGHQNKISNKYPNFFKAMNEKTSGYLIENNEIISYDRIYPSGAMDGNYLIVFNKIKISQAMVKLYNLKIVFIVIFFIIMIGLFFVVKWIVKLLSPLELVSQHLSKVSLGIIPKSKLKETADDEVGLIVRATNILIENLRATVDQANTIAKGDFSKEVLVRSDEDEFNKAMNAMTRRLSDVALLAENLSKGDYSKDIEIIDSDDKLGHALQNMIYYLIEISKVLEAIAIGDFNYEYRLVSKEDRLGIAVHQMQSNLRSVVLQADSIARGNFNQSIEPKSDKDTLGKALLEMTNILSKTREKNDNDIWFNDGISLFSKALSGIDDPSLLARKAITVLSEHIKAIAGVVYFLNDSDVLELKASYSYADRKNSYNRFAIGEGVVGQVALEFKPILIQNTNYSDENILSKVETGMNIVEPKQLYTFPLLHENKLFGVAEVALVEPLSKIHQEYLQEVSLLLATILNTASQNKQIKNLLDKSQKDYEETQVKSEELQIINAQMQEQAKQLKIQAEEMNKQNITLIEAKKDLDKQAEELMQSNKYKSEFLANVSHELRTPLNSIILLSKMLSAELEDKKQGKKAEVINDAGKDLLYLINDILDISKIEARQMQLSIKKSSSKIIVESLEALFEPIANDKGVMFIVKNNFDVEFETDDTKVIQILRNLLSNAFKFTKEGNVTLEINGENNIISFSVSDTGIGIPKDKIKHVFEAFRQVDGSISREYGGTGLGLSISLNLAKLLGGELNAQSQEGSGSTFVLSFPLNNYKVISQEQEKIAEVKSVEPDKKIDIKFNGETILLVDDDPRNIFTLSSLFQELGAETLHALNGKAALDILENNSQNVDLILMDITMPKMDGYEAIRIIRENKLYDKIAIIAVTAKVMEEDKKKCINIGANDYIPKPIDENILLKSCKLWIEKMHK